MNRPELDKSQSDKMERYYRRHARIYQATRWTFLFGRKALLRHLPIASKNAHLHLLEIGCGTGHNLARLCELYPNVQLTGLDTAAPMLEVARLKLAPHLQKVRLLQLTYGTQPLPPDIPAANIILISYCLTMINPGYETVIEQAWKDLPEGGYIAVADFHFSPVAWFRRWMQFNHVKMEKHLLPELEQRFTTDFKTVKSAYGGLWQYFIYIGHK